MYYLRARYYNPSNGRFNRVDPFSGNYSDPQSLHKYLYCHANPINATDPSGESVIGLAVSTLNILGALGMGISILSILHKVYQIGVGFKQLYMLGDLMIRLAKAGVGIAAQLQIRNYVFRLATSIIVEIGYVFLSLLKQIIREVAFGLAACVAVAAVSGLINASSGAMRIRFTKFLNARKMAKVRRMGKAGEDAAEIVVNRRHIDSLTGTAKYRVPDELTETRLTEVKNCAYVSKTNQMKDFLLYAQKHNLDFRLVVRAGNQTKLSKAILQLEEAGAIIIERTL